MAENLSSAPSRLRVGSFFLILLLLPAFSLSAFDWGLQLNQTAEFEGVSSEDFRAADDFQYSGTLIPWVSAPLDSPKGGHLYLSGGITAEYTDKTWYFMPELLRTELTLRAGENGELKLGRIQYTDPLGFVVNGLFDGASFSQNTKIGALGAGVWYTGLLYKKSAYITMTDDELVSYYEGLDYSDFGNTYFAPRRLLFALDWDNPYVAQMLRLKAALIGQFDLSGSKDLYHSQYLSLKASVPVSSFVFDLGGCLELAESSDETKISLAGEFGIGWMLPTPIRDRLMLTGRLSSGTVEDSSLAAFVPITTVSQGDVLQAKLSGLSMIRLDYAARLHESFSFIIASSYFILSDLGTYKGLPAGRDGHFLGNEFSGRIIWSPFSDLRFNLGGGVFLPSMGNTESPDGFLWRVEMSAILTIF